MATNGTTNGHSTGASPSFPAINYADVETKGMIAYRAPSLLQPHRFREAIKDAHDGKIRPLLGYFCGISAPPVAKIVAQLGYDMVAVDWEHSSCNIETMTQMVHDIQFMSEGRSHALVRVPGHDHAAIGWALDAGASIMVPQVGTVEEAKHIISAAKFGAVRNGTRSAPPARLLPGISDIGPDPSKDWQANVNQQAAIMIQIETLEAIHNLDDILTECGSEIDAVWLGTLDARVSMGLPANGGMGGTEPEWLEAVKLYESTMAKHNKPATGFSMGTTEQMERTSKGKCLVVVAADVYGLIGNGLEQLFKFREFLPQQNFKGAYKQL
ncbi:related to 2,4-dihydroxyhept-2-ene-1,7-dioic acid aldolase [Phialocephala subalpina]|uniref:Related to 2,4-dihydroxyhept-2-ene-1,7-dioic acid aldolase n=1 Tax=Phialocephala subalpina TaxID=576137 RepID=A0A1L7WY30_9HELO|nr:related to 2,4-dihydroxyhept-2-ene-1,7-dioic acid aldolase [Phialocephala subalpina]